MLHAPKKQKIEAMPPEYVKEPGKVGKLHPHWRKSFPDDEEDDDGRGKVVDVPDALRLYGEWRRVPGFWKILASDEGFIMTEGELCVRDAKQGYKHYLRVKCNRKLESVHLLVCRAFKGRPKPSRCPSTTGTGTSRTIAPPTSMGDAAEQQRNQGDHKAKSNGEPCLVWQVVGDKLSQDSPRHKPVDTERGFRR